MYKIQFRFSYFSSKWTLGAKLSQDCEIFRLPFSVRGFHIWDSAFESKHEQYELDLPDVATSSTIILKARILYYFGKKILILSLIYEFKFFPDIFKY